MPYDIPRPRNDFEERVQEAGYPWVQTVKLHPYGKADSPGHAFPIFDGLNRHQHRNSNTHLIVSGQLTITIIATGEEYTIDADDDDPSTKEVTVPANTDYKGQAGPDGAIFVEGHAILSPNTASRYERRGVVWWRDDGTNITPNQWLRRRELRKRQTGIEVWRVDTEGLYDQ